MALIQLIKQKYEATYRVLHTPGSKEDTSSAWKKYVLEIDRMYRLLTNMWNDVVDFCEDIKKEIDKIKDGTTPAGRTKGALQIQRNGVDLLKPDPFNGSKDQVANVKVPTKVSELENDVPYVTKAEFDALKKEFDDYKKQIEEEIKKAIDNSQSDYIITWAGSWGPSDSPRDGIRVVKKNTHQTWEIYSSVS